MSQEVINRYKILAKKSLGQNFLVDENISSEISRAIPVERNNIIEVWPGYWALTEKLLFQNPRYLHLIELDRSMVEILENRVMRWELEYSWVDFQIHNQDVLEYESVFDDYSVIANIPYYITSPILRKFLYDIIHKPKSMVILMQKDVWDKILWKWKNKSSVLSLMVHKKCSVTHEIHVPKESFIPSPKVESSVLKFILHDAHDNVDDLKFLEFIKKWFLSPRKKFINNLVSAWFSKAKIREFLCLQWKNENFRWEDGDIYFWIEAMNFLL